MDTVEILEAEKDKKSQRKKFPKPDWKEWLTKVKTFDWKQLGFNYRSVRARLLIIFSFIILFMSAMGITTYVTLTNTNQTVNQLIEENMVLMQNYEKANYHMAQRIASIRGYLLTNSETYLGDFETNRILSEEHEAYVLTHDNNIKTENVFRKMGEWDKYIKRNVIQVMQDGRRDEAMQNVTDYVNPKGEEIVSELTEMSDTRSDEILQQANALATGNENVVNGIVISLVTMIVITLAIAIFFSKSFSRSIKVVGNRINALATGLLNQELLAVKGGGELTELAASTNQMQVELHHIIVKIHEAATKLAQQSEELALSSSEVKAGSEQVAITMHELSTGTENQAQAAQMLAANTALFSQDFELVEVSTGEINQHSHEVMELTGRGQQLMVSSHAQMEKINHLVQEATAKMAQLDKGTQEINKLVAIIQSIASQTNLLALNASIEAARAGEHGRGFAVVAEEVRKLAEKSAESVKEITQSVEGIQAESNQVSLSLQESYHEAKAGMTGIEQTSETFQHISAALQTVVGNIKNIDQKVKGLTEKGQEMNLSITKIASVAEESAASVEETSAASQQIDSTVEEVSNQSRQLAKMAEEMTNVVRLFKVD